MKDKAELEEEACVVKLAWTSPASDHETVRHGAKRFIREVFGVERTIRGLTNLCDFHFHDSFYWYRISCVGGHWEVHQLSRLTPQGAARRAARARWDGVKHAG